MSGKKRIGFLSSDFRNHAVGHQIVCMLENLNKETEKNIILPLAQVMRDNNYNLSETLKVLLKSEYFFAPELYNSMIKSPFDFTFSLLKDLTFFFCFM